MLDSFQITGTIPDPSDVLKMVVPDNDGSSSGSLKEQMILAWHLESQSSHPLHYIHTIISSVALKAPL